MRQDWQLTENNRYMLKLEQRGGLSRGSEYFDEEYLKTQIGKRAVRGAGLSVLSQFLMISIQFGGGIVLARLLTPEDFGLVAMVSVIWLLLLFYCFLRS